MEELQDAIEDAQYVNAINTQDDGPRPVLPWETPTSDEAFQNWSKTKRWDLDSFLEQSAIAYFLFSSYIKTRHADYLRINFCEDVLRFKKMRGRSRRKQAQAILEHYILVKRPQSDTTRTTAATTTAAAQTTAITTTPHASSSTADVANKTATVNGEAGGKTMTNETVNTAPVESATLASSASFTPGPGTTTTIDGGAGGAAAAAAATGTGPTTASSLATETTKLPPRTEIDECDLERNVSTRKSTYVYLKEDSSFKIYCDYPQCRQTLIGIRDAILEDLIDDWRDWEEKEKRDQSASLKYQQGGRRTSGGGGGGGVSVASGGSVSGGPTSGNGKTISRQQMAAYRKQKQEQQQQQLIRASGTSQGNASSSTMPSALIPPTSAEMPETATTAHQDGSASTEWQTSNLAISSHLNNPPPVPSTTQDAAAASDIAVQPKEEANGNENEVTAPASKDTDDDKPNPETAEDKDAPKEQNPLVVSSPSSSRPNGNTPPATTQTASQEVQPNENHRQYTASSTVSVEQASTTSGPARKPPARQFSERSCASGLSSFGGDGDFIEATTSMRMLTQKFFQSQKEAVYDSLFDKAETVVMESLRRDYWDAFLQSEEFRRAKNFLWYQDRPVVPEDFYIMRVLGRGGFGLVNGALFLLFLSSSSFVIAVCCS